MSIWELMAQLWVSGCLYSMSQTSVNSRKTVAWGHVDIRATNILDLLTISEIVQATFTWFYKISQLENILDGKYFNNYIKFFYSQDSLKEDSGCMCNWQQQEWQGLPQHLSTKAGWYLNSTSLKRGEDIILPTGNTSRKEKVSSQRIQLIKTGQKEWDCVFPWLSPIFSTTSSPSCAFPLVYNLYHLKITPASAHFDHLCTFTQWPLLPFLIDLSNLGGRAKAPVIR